MEDTIKKTQAELGAIIQTPKLTDKLLSRPPFRFLHDVVVAVLQASSFPEGLYADAQLDSANVTDKKAKLDFLEQLIAVVEAGTGAPVPARAAKIAAGEEPEKTNALLQGLAACAGLSSDQKKAAVKKVKGGAAAEQAPPPAPKAEAAPKAAAPTAAAPSESEEERQKRHDEERRRRHEEKKREKEKAAKAAEAAAAAAAEETKQQPQPDADAERRRRREEKKREAAAAAAAAAAGGESTSVDAPSTSAPAPNATPTTTTAGPAMTATARKAPPRTKPTHEVIDAQRGADATPAAGVIREGKKNGAAAAGGEESDEDDAQDWQKVAAQYEAKPTARTAAVAEGAEVRGMLGQQALKAKRDQEEAQRRGENGEEASAVAPPANGGIVIRNSRNTVSRGGGGHALGDGDLNQLREQLQMLTKASNPLGKFLEAIHDDIDSMTRELEMWRSESRSQALAAAEARRQTEESLQEIHANLQNLEDAISDQMLKTNNLRQTILSNDAAMETMMKTIVNPDIAAQ